MYARLEVVGGDGEGGGDVEEAAAETMETDKTIVTRRSKQHKNRRLKNGRQVSAHWRSWRVVKLFQSKVGVCRLSSFINGAYRGF